MVNKTKLGRRSSKKTVANKLLKKTAITIEQHEAQKTLERAVKYYDKAMHKVARTQALLIVSQQRKKATMLHAMSRNNTQSRSSSLKVKNALVVAIENNKAAKVTVVNAEKALDSLIKHVAVLEKKNDAREKAASTFLAKWDGQYNRKHRIVPAQTVFEKAITRKR